MSQFVQSAQDFRLDGVILTSERLKKNINITNLVSEIDIFESIQSLYLTGYITILDDQDIFNIVDIQGTERLEITVSANIDDENSIQIIKNFVLVNVEKAIKTNDHSVVYSLYMIEDIGYFNNVQKISAAYDGTPESIIEKIIKRTINRSLYGYNSTTQRGTTFQPSAQRTKRYIAPYVNPFTSIDHILPRTTTRQGLPYFAHSSLVFDDLFLRDLESIIKQPAFNKDFPFVFSQSQTNRGADNPLIDAFTISEMTSEMTDDTMFLAQIGAIGSVIRTLSASYGDDNVSLFNAYTFFDNLKRLEIIPQDSKYLLDENFIPDPSKRNPDTLQQYTSRIFRQVTGNVTRENDVDNLYSESNISENNLPVYAYILREYLLKNILTITVPGLNFLFKDPRRTVGNQIELLTFKSSIPSGGAELPDFRDPRKSGNFIMLHKRHIFNCVDFKHNCVIQCGRIQQEAYGNVF